jgi:D-tyrosyl-tRNA(Tyr) deacylase
VTRASVRVGFEVTGRIGAGLVVLVGVEDGDTEADASLLARKTVGLRIFDDDSGRMDRDVLESGGAILAVSQFTLLGDCRKGRRPSWTRAARPEVAVLLYEAFVTALREAGVKVETGVFQAAMEVELSNHGPVTLLVDTREAGPRKKP